MIPIASLKSKKVSKLLLNPINITGKEPRIRMAVYTLRGPILSHKYPITKRATMVMATEAIMISPICDFVSDNSSRTIAIMGAIPNQPKKHRKKAIHVIWKARICGVLKLRRLILVALALFFITIKF